MPDNVSPALTLYLMVTAVGPAVGVEVDRITGIIVTGAESGVRVLDGVGVKPIPNAVRRDGPFSAKKINVHAMRMTTATPAITSQGGEPVFSSRCAGTRCTMRCLRQGSSLPGRDGGGVDGCSCPISLSDIIADLDTFANML